jgi:DNA-3-methyladenine glycosylase II
MNPETVAELCRLDPALRPLIERVGPITLEPDAGMSPYQMLGEAIVYQQLTAKAAGTILGRVKALFPRKRFPRPEDLLRMPLPKLRSAGLSRAKALALKDLAAKTRGGVVPSSRQIGKLSNGEIIERLIAIRGIGQWTIEMMLIFKLGRPDVMPATDYGVRKGFARVFGRSELPKPKELLAFSERWKPHRTTVAWYLWRALELPKED